MSHHASHSYTWDLNLTDPTSQACHRDLRKKTNKQTCKNTPSRLWLCIRITWGHSGNVKFKVDHITPSLRWSSKSQPQWDTIGAHIPRYKGHSRDVWELEANKCLSFMTMAWRLKTYYPEVSLFTGMWTGLFCIFFCPQELSHSLNQSRHMNNELMLNGSPL